MPAPHPENRICNLEKTPARSFFTAGLSSGEPASKKLKTDSGTHGEKVLMNTSRSERGSLGRLDKPMSHRVMEALSSACLCLVLGATLSLEVHSEN